MLFKRLIRINAGKEEKLKDMWRENNTIRYNEGDTYQQQTQQ